LPLRYARNSSADAEGGVQKIAVLAAFKNTSSAAFSAQDADDFA
jgi:hypothetical protein